MELQTIVQQVAQRLQNYASEALSNDTGMHPADAMELAQQLRDATKQGE